MKKTFLCILMNILATFPFMTYSQEKITITVNGRSASVILADTEAAHKLKSFVEENPVTVRMNEYGGFEKVGELPWSLPTDNRQITTSPGDIMLYQGRNMVIFYGSNTWAYTPLGRIEGMTPEEIRSFLGEITVDATLSPDYNTGIDRMLTADKENTEVYTLQGERVDMSGRSVSELPAGLYIIDGRKQLIR